MQLRFRSKYERGLSSKGTNKSFLFKIVLSLFIFFIAIVLLDKIDMPAPNKLIKQEITNDKLITLK